MLVTLTRPAGVSTGPESVNTTHYAACGKASPIRVPAKRGSKVGLVKCNFEAVLPQAALMMEAAEAAVAARAANGSVAAAEASEGLLSPDVALVVVAKPSPQALGARGAPITYGLPEARSPLAKAVFDIPNKACVTVKEGLAGSLAKYMLGAPAAAPRTLCGSAEVVTNTRVGGFDAAACGQHTLSLAPAGAALDVEALPVAVTITGCTKAAVGRPNVALTKLAPVHIYNHTWSTAVAAVPLPPKAVNGTPPAPVDMRALQLPANGVASANFTVQLTKGAAQDLGNHLQVWAAGCGGMRVAGIHCLVPNAGCMHAPCAPRAPAAPAPALLTLPPPHPPRPASLRARCS